MSHSSYARVVSLHIARHRSHSDALHMHADQCAVRPDRMLPCSLLVAFTCNYVHHLMVPQPPDCMISQGLTSFRLEISVLPFHLNSPTFP